MHPSLQLKGLHKSFDGVAAVRDMNLTLEKGEFLSLLGPSGCGKSTTLGLIAGFLEPDDGDILVDGARVNDLPARSRGIGLVFQDYAVFSRLSVEANLAFGLEARGVPRRERRKRIDEMAEKLQLAGLLKHRGGSLNMSEMQRVAIARVLVTRPSLLLLDEPMSNLDAALRTSLRSELKAIQKDLGQTVLYVTHDQVEAMSMSDRIAVMSEGGLVQIDPPDRIYHQPTNRFVAEFIGDPPINMIACEITDACDGVRVTTALHALSMAANASSMAANASPGQHILAIRPHDITVSRKPTEGSAPAKVVLVENLGAENVVHVAYGEAMVSIISPPRFTQAGQIVHLSIDASNAHLIHASSGQVMTRMLERVAA